MPAPNLDFGKYAAFIWAAYGLSAIVLGVLVLQTWLSARRWRREAERRRTAP